MKYQSEADFCEEVCKLIAGLFIGTERENVIFVPEAPIDYFSNNQIDMLLLDTKNLKYLCIEFKLNDYNTLLYQLRRVESHGIHAVGIINSRPQKITPERETVYDYIPEAKKVFSYTGLDEELELLSSHEKGLLYEHRWQSIYSGKGMVYYWAYKNEQSKYRGGITSGNRDGFAKIYRQAIKNLHAHYGRLDFMLTYGLLGNYSVSSAKKYYRQAT